MFRCSAATAALLVALAAGAPARAQETPATTGDLKCALVGFALATSERKEEQQAGLMLAFYYYGRLSAAPGVQVEKRLKEVADAMTDEAFVKESTRCGDELAQVGESMQRFGESMGRKP
ncbi:hypothetical protein [Phenylobacterium sp.]|uniref:hypothetical protein n=1 Tax=Phenylobacterium sp. TaxID=1871053 RepID=UPI0035B1FDF3